MCEKKGMHLLTVASPAPSSARRDSTLQPVAGEEAEMPRSKRARTDAKDWEDMRAQVLGAMVVF